jgi:hypothetical protein
MIAKMGRLISALRAKASRRMDTQPANCDQNKDLNEPICLEKTPPKKIINSPSEHAAYSQ